MGRQAALTTCPKTADISIQAIAVAEYLAGVHLGADPSRQSAQKAFLDEALTIVSVIAYDRTVAEHHADLLAHTTRADTKRGARDLIVAATARAADRIVLTTDARATFFSADLPGVTARIASASEPSRSSGWTGARLVAMRRPVGAGAVQGFATCCWASGLGVHREAARLPFLAAAAARRRRALFKMFSAASSTSGSSIAACNASIFATPISLHTRPDTV
jgi:tRNA(fMet)-specific endonuclease VapC